MFCCSSLSSCTQLLSVWLGELTMLRRVGDSLTSSVYFSDGGGGPTKPLTSLNNLLASLLLFLEKGSERTATSVRITFYSDHKLS